MSKRKLKREKEAYNTKEEKEEGADSDSAVSETESLCLSPDEENVEHSKAPKNMLDLQKQLEDLASNDDDDDAPEEITFAAGKKNALDKLKELRDQIAREKLKKKEVRRNRELANQEQKKRKLSSKVDVKSDDDSDVAEADREEEEEAAVVSGKKHVTFSDDEKEIDSEGNEDDFISFSESGTMQPVRIKDVERMCSGMERAQLFRDQQLFGGRIKRETMAERNSRSDKRRARRTKVTPKR